MAVIEMEMNINQKSIETGDTYYLQKEEEKSKYDLVLKKNDLLHKKSMDIPRHVEKTKAQQFYFEYDTKHVFVHFIFNCRLIINSDYIQ